MPPNLIPRPDALQYQGIRRPIGAQGHCTVCHGIAMDFPIHHEGMIKEEG